MRAIALALAVMMVGCGVELTEQAPYDTAEEALAIEPPISELSVELDGKPVGTLESFSLHAGKEPSLGSAVLEISESGELLDWLAAALSKQAVEKQVSVVGVSASGKRRRIDMSGCLIKELTLPKLEAKDNKKQFEAMSAPRLEAKQGKKHFEVTVEFEVEDVTYSKGDGKLGAAKAGAVATPIWDVSIPGLDSENFTEAELPTLTANIVTEDSAVAAARLPTRHYAAWEVSGLSVETDKEAAKKLATKVLRDGAISDSEYIDIGVNIKDQSMKTSGTFTFRSRMSAGKVGGPHDGTTLVEFVVDEVRLDVKHD